MHGELTAIAEVLSVTLARKSSSLHITHKGSLEFPYVAISPETPLLPELETVPPTRISSGRMSREERH
jgi:hypothetical protein